MEHTVNESCRKHFDWIDKRLDEGDDEFKEHGEKIIKVETNIDNLTKSLDGVTKALWGVAFSIGGILLGALISFLFWYLENK